MANAIKFTDQGWIRVRWTWQHLDDGLAELDISVHDSGPDIAPEDGQRLFADFSQGRSGLSQAQGSGLGLALSKRLVELMGGQLYWRSEPGVGSLFGIRVALPLAPAPAWPAPPPALGWRLCGLPPLLAETLADSDDAEVNQRLASRMVDEAHRAAGTIDDLLELSRIELGGRGEQVEVNVASVLSEAVARHRLTAESAGVNLVRDDTNGLVVRADRLQLVSALSNLVDNAVKYSNPGGSVRLTAQETDGVVEITVADQGVGIPARDIDRIFERFYRVDRARSRETGGTGLGLAIVRHIATNHGGDVTVRSREGEGSTFTLRIPRQEADQDGH